MSSLNPARPLSTAAGQRGFSAIEVTAVAAIIAVLALILVPAVNKRVDESKIAAAKDDLSSIQKAEELAYGYTGHYFRLCDLDRPQPDLPLPPTSDTVNYPLVKLRVPQAYWNGQIMLESETTYLLNNWKGPFLPLHRTMSVSDLIRSRPEMVVSSGMAGVTNGPGNDGLGGPLFFYPGDDFNWKCPTGGAISGIVNGAYQEALQLQYPIDPWGNPYIFFGSGRYGDPGVTNFALIQGDKADENSWGTAAVYSMGPDGVPGNVNTVDSKKPVAYFRELWVLGTGDDLAREF